MRCTTDKARGGSTCSPLWTSAYCTSHLGYYYSVLVFIKGVLWKFILGNSRLELIQVVNATCIMVPGQLVTALEP